MKKKKSLDNSCKIKCKYCEKFYSRTSNLTRHQKKCAEVGNKKVADLTKIKATLGFIPEIDFKTGVTRFAKWVKTQGIQEDKYEKSIEQYYLQSFEINVLSKEQTLLEKIVSLIRFSFQENTIESLSEKIQKLEHEFFPKTIEKIILK